ncbi:MAG: hypothetical protein WCV00_18140 [Verrucomicrobiia bacterium]|jgi:hypothetical protein
MDAGLAVFSERSASQASNAATQPSSIVSETFNALTLDHARQPVKRSQFRPMA